MSRRWLLGLWACVLFQTGGVFGQGLLIVVDRPMPLPRPIPVPTPTPQATYVLKEINVQATLVDQIAKVQVGQTFQNTGSSQLEVQFVFPLPYDGAIDSLTLMVDGKEYPAALLSAHEARKRYEAIVRTNRDPALLEYLGTGMFQTSVFPVPPGATRQVSLTYKQLLRKERGLTDFLFPLSTAKYTAQAVQKVDVQVRIESSQEIKNVYSPTHAVDIQRPEPKQALVKWTRSNETPGNDFRLFYDVGDAGLVARVITYRPKANEDGYFLMLASPPAAPPTTERLKKTVLFVVDKSGSMSGPKIEQAKGALRFVLNNLRDGDLFNIVSYEGEIAPFRPELQVYGEQTRAAALGFIDGLYAGGGTNIHGALTHGLAQLQDSNQPTYVLFLTDGLPTVGVTGEPEIVAATKAGNRVRARVLPFGVGYDVNSRLLDKLARENLGVSEYVRPDEDIEAHVARVYNRISSPVLANVAVTFGFDGVQPQDPPVTSRHYPAQVADLFAGEQLVIVGRYAKTGAAKITVTGQAGTELRTIDFPAEFVTQSADGSYAFVEKLWATRRIGELIDQLDLQGQNSELVKELVELSTKHGILTPYTSFLADETTRVDMAAIDRNSAVTVENLRRLSEVDGRGGVAQRMEKARFQNSAQAVSGPEPFGGNSFKEIGSDEYSVTTNVRSAGKDVLYCRAVPAKPGVAGQKVLVTPETAELDLAKLADDVTTIDRYTDAYFALVQANTADENLLFAQQAADEHLLVKLRGKTFLVK